MLKTALRLLLAFGVSGGCFYWATKGTDWANVGHLMGAADPRWLLGVVVLSLASHFLRAQRWRVLLRPVVDAPYGTALSATLVGFAATMVLPLRAGEVVRPWLLARRLRIGLAPAAASVVVERLLDMLLVLTCFVIVTFSYPKLAEYRPLALLAAAAAGSVLGLLYWSARRRQVADAIVERLTARLPLRARRLAHFLAAGVMDGARGLGDARTLLLVLASSAVLWTFITGTYAAAFLAMSLAVPLVTGSLATVVIVAAFVFLPQAPGFTGTWNAACDMSLKQFGVPHDQVVAYGLITWLIQIVVNVGAGAVALAFQDLSVRDLVAVSKEGASAAQVERS